MLVITIQNQRFICIFPFETMVTMANYSFSIQMNFKKCKIKIHQIQLYALVQVMDIVIIIVSNGECFAKKIQNDSYDKNHFDGKKI